MSSIEAYEAWLAWRTLQTSTLSLYSPTSHPLWIGLDNVHLEALHPKGVKIFWRGLRRSPLKRYSYCCSKPLKFMPKVSRKPLEDWEVQYHSPDLGEGSWLCLACEQVDPEETPAYVVFDQARKEEVLATFRSWASLSEPHLFSQELTALQLWSEYEALSTYLTYYLSLGVRERALKILSVDDVTRDNGRLARAEELLTIQAYRLLTEGAYPDTRSLNLHSGEELLANLQAQGLKVPEV